MFIDFEGIDGSGKTTLSNRVAARLRQLDIPVCHAREGGELASPIAENIRNLTRDVHNLELSETAELLLYAAREAQTVSEVIRPALARGEWVIADRYVYSHLALAREGRGLDHPALEKVLEFASGGIEPDLVILVDVEPSIARARKRCQKVRDNKPSTPSRKSQGGAGLTSRVRRGFLELARRDPERWVVFDNTWASLDDAVETLVQLVLERAGLASPVPMPVQADPSRLWTAAQPPRDEAELRRALLNAVDVISQREPPLAAWMLNGMSGLDVDERRLRLARHAPAIVAHGLRDVGGDEAMTLRHVLKAIEPRQVARSLTGLGDEESYHLRAELVDRAPAEVARSLEGLEDPTATALRHTLAPIVPADVLFALRGLDTIDAWRLREELAGRAPPDALADSLTGLDSPHAWNLRDELLGPAPLAVIESLLGVGGERAHALRIRFMRTAPRAVLESLIGLEDEIAWRMRESVGERMREAVESVVGLDSERAWTLRANLAEAWPAACAKSLMNLTRTPRGAGMLFGLLEAFPGDLELLRCAAWVVDPARGGGRKAKLLDHQAQAV